MKKLIIVGLLWGITLQSMDAEETPAQPTIYQIVSIVLRKSSADQQTAPKEVHIKYVVEPESYGNSMAQWIDILLHGTMSQTQELWHAFYNHLAGELQTNIAPQHRPLFAQACDTFINKKDGVITTTACCGKGWSQTLIETFGFEIVSEEKEEISKQEAAALFQEMWQSIYQSQ